jgi:LysR family transcriptional activator of nhaA
MEWLNYHHLFYFWTVAREGSIAKAGEKLRLAHPTISGQLRVLEESLGHKLFTRQGRGLALTEFGQLVYRYADEIFSIGREMLETLKGRAPGRPVQLTVGVANAVPKLIVHRILGPVLNGQPPVHLVCREDSTEALMAELATHEIDVVISDVPPPTHVRVKVFGHLLGESDTTLFAASPLASKLRRRFPRSVNEAPLFLPATTTALRRGIDQWLEAEDLHPLVVGEFDDSALMKAFGQAGTAVFPGPSVIAPEIVRQYRVQVVGRIPVRERYYAISVERRLKHPAVLALTNRARMDLFG